MGDSQLGQLGQALDVSSLVMSLKESAKQDWSRGSCLVRTALLPYTFAQQADHSGAISWSWKMVHTIWTACMVAGQLPEY